MDLTWDKYNRETNLFTFGKINETLTINDVKVTIFMCIFELK